MIGLDFIRDRLKSGGQAVSARAAKIRGALTTILAVISIMGLVTFSQFILEEAFQTAMFGTWPAQDAGRWDIVKEGVELMEHITFLQKFVNYGFGWIQPLGFVSYGAYAKSSAFYTKAMRAKAMANAPQLFEGHEVEINLPISEARIITGGLEARNGAVVIRFRPDQRAAVMAIKGVIQIENNLAVVDIRGQQ